VFHISKKPALQFNAYAELFAIFKQENESLTSLMVRIDQAMQNIYNLCPPQFTLADLDDELQSMAMIRSLSADYQSFRSSLMLLDQIDKHTLQEAFKNEEIQHLQAQNLAPTAPAQALAISNSPAALASHPKPPFNCNFCGCKGHTMQRCHQFAKAKKLAQQKAAEQSDQSANPAQAKDTTSPA
jgi:hypothetical protein